jgi:hypothetical protein
MWRIASLPVCSSLFICCSIGWAMKTERTCLQVTIIPMLSTQNPEPTILNGQLPSFLSVIIAKATVAYLTDLKTVCLSAILILP